MFVPGLVSITFRSLAPEEIIDLIVETPLKAVEWGGDVHVPHGDIRVARTVGEKTRAAGLAVASYGSYYRTGVDDSPPFAQVLRSAVALQTPVIRVWAGRTASAEADSDWWAVVCRDAERIADLAAAEGIRVAFEYHGNTLTDTPAAAERLMQEIAHPNVSIYWQPLPHLTMQERLEGLARILPWLGYLHVFYWQGRERRPLAEGAEQWAQYASVLRQADWSENGFKGTRYGLLEFVQSESRDQFRADAACLETLLP